MPVRRVECHPYVAENVGRIALMRGPVLYCVEQVDNPHVAELRDLVLPADADFSAGFEPSLLDGVTVLNAEARAVAPDEEWEKRLYSTVRPSTGGDETAEVLTAVPYHAWANPEPSSCRSGYDHNNQGIQLYES